MKSDINDLVATEGRFRTLIENSADAIVLLDSNGIIRYQSPAYAKMMGYNDIQRIGRKSLEFVHPDDHSVYIETFNTVMENPGRPVKFFLRKQHNCGSWHRLGCIANNLLEDSGIQSIVVNIHDTTDNWNAEEALRKSEGLYADLILNQIAGVYRILIKKPVPGQPIWNSLTHEFVSDRFCDIIGLEKSEIDNLPSSVICDLIHPDDRAGFISSNEEANRTLSSFIWEGRVIIHEKIKWVRFDSNPRKLDDESVRWTGVMIDITKQKQGEEQLKKNSDRLMKINDCLSSLGVDSDLNINRLTALCGELLNATFALYNRLCDGSLFPAGKWHTPEEFIVYDSPDGHLCYDVIRNNREDTIIITGLPQTCYVKTDPNVLAFGLITYCGHVVRSEGVPVGSLCVVYNIDFQMSDEDLKIIGIIASAIGNEDSRKFRGEALKASEAKLKDLNATKDKFFSIIAHDLKGPFNGIIGLSEILKEEAAHLNVSSITEYAVMIHSSALQSHRLLDNLLSWARVQEGKMSFKPVSNELYSVVSEIILLFKNIAGRKKIVIINKVPSHIIVIADSEMLKTILRNLISNAVKFTGINGKVKISASTGMSGVEIVVGDNGGGIRADDLCKLFRIDNVFTTRGTENEKGTGLGLVLCNEFVEKHGGCISVKSKSGKGSKFRFTLPSNSNY